MKNPSLILTAFGHALGTVAYVALVATVMQQGEHLFGRVSSFWGPIGILMLFVLSATVTGSLVLGRPMWLYFEGKKKEALLFFFYTVGFLALGTIAIFLSLALRA